MKNQQNEEEESVKEAETSEKKAKARVCIARGEKPRLDLNKDEMGMDEGRPKIARGTWTTARWGTKRRNSRKKMDCPMDKRRASLMLNER